MYIYTYGMVYLIKIKTTISKSLKGQGYANANEILTSGCHNISTYCQ